MTNPADPVAEAPRPLWGRRRSILFAAAVFLLLAAGTRFYQLGRRPFHHDESIHAHLSYTLARDGNFRYDPAYHGPFLYYANALVYKTFGDSDTTARLLPALFGMLLIGFAWPLARWIGKPAAVAYALFVLISPHLTYFSRFIREDLYSLVFTLATILAFRKFLETDRARWLTLSAVSFALAGVTKENAYMTGVLFVVFGAWLFLERVLRQRPYWPALREAARDTWGWISRQLVALLAAGMIFLFIWALMYTAFGKYPMDWFAIPKAVKYWMGQHAIARIPGPWYYYFPQLLFYETATVLAGLILMPLLRKELWKDRFVRSVGCAMAGLGLYALFQDLTAGSALAKILPLLTLAAVAVGAIQLLRGARPAGEPSGPAHATTQPEPGASDPGRDGSATALGAAQLPDLAFLRFLVFWALGSLAIYSWAREKVPWLTVHPLLPVTLLAAVAVSELWRLRRQTRALLALGAVALLTAVNTSGMLLACFRYGAHDKERRPANAEILAYVQTSEEMVRALAPIEKARSRVPAGEPVITIAGDAVWPLSWYLRDMPAKWPSRVEEATTPIIVADWSPEGKIEEQLRERYHATRTPIRSWWFPEAIPAKDQKPARWPSVSQVLRWWLFHEIWSPIGSQDAVVFVRKDLEGSGPLEPIRLAVQDTSPRDYPESAVKIPEARSWGGAGFGPGEFSEPRAAATDARGNIYVADTKNHRIQVFDASGQFLRKFGSRGTADGQLNEPCGLAVDRDGVVWVADTWNHRIVRFGPEGNFLGSIVAEDGFFGPRGVLISRDSLYVADTGNKRIVRFDLEGDLLKQWGGNGTEPGQFIEPVGLIADASGNVYVADTGNRRIQVFDAEGDFLRQFPVHGWRDFYTEPHLAIGPSDTLFVTDASEGRIAQYSAHGELRRSWRPEGSSKAPTGISLSPFGILIVADRGTHRVFTWGLSDLLR